MNIYSLSVIAFLMTFNLSYAAPLDWCQTNETPLPQPGNTIVAGQRYIGAVPNKTNTKHLTGPATLDQADTKYILDNDVVADGTAFTITASNVVLDLNKKKVVYGNKDGMSFGVTINAWNKIGIEVFNGQIIQGAGKCAGNLSGLGCNPIGTSTSPFARIAGVSLEYDSPDTAGIYCYYGRVVVQDSTIEDNGTIVTNRHQGFGAIHVEKASAQVFRNKVKARHRGIGVGSHSKVYQNIIHVNSWATNAYGIMAFGIDDFEFYGNQITGEGQHPISIGFVAGATNGKIYSNYMQVENSTKSEEYGNVGASCIRSTWGADKVDVSCNTCQLHGGNHEGQVGSDPWYSNFSWGRAFWLGINPGNVVKVHHNVVETFNDNGKAYVPALALVGGYNSAGLEVSDNVFSGNGILVSVGDSYGSATGFPLIKNNKFIKTGGANPMQSNIRSIYGGQTVEANFVDNIFTEPLSPANVKLDGCNSGSVEVRIKDGQSSYILSDFGQGVTYNECVVRR